MTNSKSTGKRSLGDLIVSLYRRRHELPLYHPPPHKTAIQAARTEAYWERLNADPVFVAELLMLFLGWDWSAADRFAIRWGLPRFALKDLAWSRDLWLIRGKRNPRLEVGSRMFPGLGPGATAAEARSRGYGSWPDHVFDPNTYSRGAGLLYARAVEGQPWQDIAATDQGIDRGLTDTKFVRRRVKALAKALGVRLPNIPRGRRRGRHPA